MMKKQAPLNIYEKQRISKLIANYGKYSRRQVDFFIKNGKVLVNGKVAKLGEKISVKDNVIINDEPVKFTFKKYYYLLNKPKGYISERIDKYGKTALSLINNYQKVNLFTIGRLDVNTTGLILITNDGFLSNYLIRPENKIKKTYLVWLEKPIDNNLINQFKRGLILEDGTILKPVKNFKVIQNTATKTLVKMVIFEGKNNQIRRMFTLFNNKVINLKRVKIGKLSIDNLPTGKYWTYQKTEIYKLLGVQEH